MEFKNSIEFYFKKIRKKIVFFYGKMEKIKYLA